MNGVEASPSVTAGDSDLDGTPSRGDELWGGVMSAAEVGPEVSLGSMNAHLYSFYKVYKTRSYSLHVKTLVMF